MRNRPLVTPQRTALMAARSHGLRGSTTPTEQALWRELSGSKLGVAFRRQVVIGNRYIVDFLAPSARLVIEVDGGYHQQRAGADARRDRLLARLGYRVLRLDAELVRNALPEAVARVRAELNQVRGA